MGTLIWLIGEAVLNEESVQSDLEFRCFPTSTVPSGCP